MKILWDLWENIMQSKICIIKVPEGKKKMAGSLFEETMVKTFLTWGQKQIARSMKPRKFQKRWHQRDLHQDEL